MFDDGEIVEDVQLDRVDWIVEDVGVFNLPNSVHQLHGCRLPVLLAYFGLHGGIGVKQLRVENNFGKLRELLPEPLEIGLEKVPTFKVAVSELDLVSDLHFLGSAWLLSADQGIISILQTRIVLALGNSLDRLRPGDNGF